MIPMFWHISGKIYMASWLATKAIFLKFYLKSCWSKTDDKTVMQHAPDADIF